MDSSNFQQVLKVEGRHIALFFFKKKNNYVFHFGYEEIFFDLCKSTLPN